MLLRIESQRARLRPLDPARKAGRNKLGNFKMVGTVDRSLAQERFKTKQTLRKNGGWIDIPQETHG